MREENPGIASASSKNKDSADVIEEMSSEDWSLMLGDRSLRRRVGVPFFSRRKQWCSPSGLSTLVPGT